MEGSILAVERNRGVIVLLDLGAIDCDSSKQAFGTRVAQGLRVHLPVGACRSMPPNRACCRRCLAAEFKLAGEQPLHTLVIHEQHDKIDGLAASLEAKIASTDRNECWRTPSMGRAAGNHTASMLSADDEYALPHAWHHSDALSAIQHFFRDALVRRHHDLMQHDASILQACGAVLQSGSGER